MVWGTWHGLGFALHSRGDGVGILRSPQSFEPKFFTGLPNTILSTVFFDHEQRRIADFDRIFEVVLAERAEAEELVGEPIGTIAHPARRFSVLSRDRANAQLVMEQQIAP